MKNMTLNAKGMLFGIIGSLIGTFPNVVLKTFLAFSDFGEACFDLFNFETAWDIVITPCGLLSFVGWSFWGTFIPAMVAIAGGALFGLLGMQIGYKRAEKRGYNLGRENWKGTFWWSFFGGVLFDLLFIFMVIFPGY